MNYLISSLIAVLIILFTTTGAFAEVSDPQEQPDHQAQDTSKEDLERAQEHFDRGAQLYFEGEFSRAAVEFRRAHNFHPHPLFLYNIALMYKRLGRHEDALEAARQALEMDTALPPTEDARNKGIIVAVETSLLGQTIADEIDQKDGEEVEPVAEVTDDSGFGALGWAGVGTLGLGVAGLVGGGIVHLNLQNNVEEYELRRRRNPDSQGVTDLGDTIAAQETQRMALFISGAGLAAVGTGLIFWATRSGAPDSQVAFSVSVVNPGLSASFRW